MTRYTVLALHRRAGKTTLGIAILINSALKGKVGLYTYIAPEKAQAKLIAWDALKRIVDPLRTLREGNKHMVEIYETDLSVRFANGSKIILLGADKPDRLRGSKLCGAVLDEVAQMPRETWSEIVQPALIDSEGYALFIGTPKGINLFSELFERGKDPQYQPDWSSRRYTCDETDALTPEQIHVMQRDLAPEEFRREMLCDFDAQSSDQLISLSLANEAAQRNYKQEAISVYNTFMGVDVARFGTDASCIFIRKGKKAFHPFVFRGLPITELALKVRDLHREYGVDTVYVDGTGVGGGAVDCIRAVGINCFDIDFSRKAEDQGYINKRTEMWFNMRNWLESGGEIPKIQQLIKEISTPTYERTESNRLKLETKKDIKARLGKSPDMADALALTFCNYASEINMERFDALTLSKEERALRERERQIAQAESRDYDPIARFEKEIESRTGYYQKETPRWRSVRL